jgi:hypothetical protein
MDNKKYVSHAEWPEDVYISEYGDHVSTDTHNTKLAADSVCRGLVRDGFGGERKRLPLRVWVTEEPFPHTEDR